MLRQIRGILILTLTAFIWGTAFAAQRMGMDHIGPMTFVGVRFLIATLALLPVIFVGSATGLRLGGENTGSRGDLARGGILCGAVIFLVCASQQVGLLYTTVGKSGFITALYIVVVPIFGLFMGKGVRRFTWFCVGIAVCGMYLLCVNESVSINRGDALTFFCAVFFAAHIMIVDRYSPKVDGIKLSAIQFFVCGTLAMTCAFIFESPSLSGIISGVWPLLYAGVLSSGLAFTLQIIGQRDVNPVAASLIMSIESVFAALTGWLILNEVLSAKEIAGCAMILAASVLIQVAEAKKSAA